jgi:16S rRNA (guanine527-N7)-methyltransferase
MQPTQADLATKLRELVSALGEPPLAPTESAALVAFAALVASWNHRVDLTGAKTAKDLVEVLLADALVMRDRVLVPEGARVLDVGTGVGAPIVPFLLLRPDVHAVCVEPRRKRVAFLRTAMGQLSLVPRMVVKEGRIEPGAPELEQAPGATVACSRATFAPPMWLELGLKLAPRALLFAARDGLLEAPAGSALIAQRSYMLPSTGSPRALGAYARS